jgi:hypothetical protein
MSQIVGNGSRTRWPRRVRSPLIRRLVETDDDPGKQWILGWFKLVGDDELRRFGLSADDIEIIRNR